MKKALLTSLSLLFVCVAFTQTPVFEWAHRFGTTADIIVYDNAVDGDGNIYFTGEFSGTVDFDPGPGNASRAAHATDGRDGFVLKLNAAGQYVWVSTFGGTGIDFGTRIAVNASQQVVVAGRYQGGLGFVGTGPNTGIGTSVGDYDGIILKLNTQGDLQWFKALSGIGAEFFTGVDIDSNGNVYATGSFNQSTTLQTPSAPNGFQTYTFSPSQNGTYDWMVTKLNTNGHVSWAYSFGNVSNDIAYNLKLSPDESSLAICGEFNGSVDFDGKAGAVYFVASVSITSSVSAFIQLLDAPTGSIQWAKSMGSQNQPCNAYEAEFDAHNNVYVAGRFGGATAYFNNSNSLPTLQNADATGQSFDAYVAKYDVNGLPVWVKGFGTSAMGQNAVSINSDQLNAVSVDSQGNVYVAGTYNGLNGIDIDPSPSVSLGVPNYGSTAGTKDIFLVKLNASGNFSWGTSFTGSNNNDEVWGLSVDVNNNIIVSGYFNATQLDLNPISANGDGLVTGNVAGSQDMFVTKLSQPPPAACIVTIPDANFKAYLVGNAAVNTNGDGEIQCNEASAFTGMLNMNTLNISNLTGVEAFVNMTEILVSNNQLTAIDLSANLALTAVYANNNSLTSFNMANGNNENFTVFITTGNPNLTCIQVDNVTYSNTNWTGGNFSFDAGVSFSLNCSAVNNAPVLTVISNMNVIADVEQVNYPISSHASDPDADPLTYSLDATSLGKGMTITANGTLQWTPASINIGTHNVTVTISDGALTANRSFTITVIAQIPACAITNVVVVDISACDELVNDRYIINLDVYYEHAPSSGTVIVNGINFTVATSPQRVTLFGDADGNFVDVEASFSEESTCTYFQSQAWQAPLSCALQPPVLASNTGLTVVQGNQTTITTSMLNVTDADNTAEEIVYTVTALPVNGTLRKNTNALTLNGTFTQADVTANLISYLHNGFNGAADKFTFTVSDGEGGSIASTDFNIQIDIVLGVEDQDSGLSLYPVPASHEISLHMVNSYQGEVNIQLTDMAGKSLLTSRVNKVSAELKHTINVAHLPSGVAIVHVQIGSQLRILKILKK